MKSFFIRFLSLSALLISMTTATGAAKDEPVTVIMDLNTAPTPSSTVFALPKTGVFDPESPGYGPQLEDPLAVTAYNTLLEQLSPDKNEVSVDLKSFELTEPDQFITPMKAALAAFVFDHPESQYCTALQFSYTMLPGQDGNPDQILTASYLLQQEPDAQQMKDSLDAVLSTFRENFDRSLPVMEQYRYIHDYICDLATYDYDAAMSGILSDAHNAYGLLVNGNAVVCEGYSKSFKLLCDAVDLPCILVAGEAVEADTEGNFSFTGLDNHMWNLVELDGNWYSVDTTWDDTDGYTLDGCPGMLISFSTYDYFLRNAAFLNGAPTQDHRSSGNIYFQSNFPMEFGLPALYEGAYPAAESLSTKNLNILYSGAALNIPDIFWRYSIGATALADVPALTFYLTQNLSLSAPVSVPEGKTYILDSFSASSGSISFPETPLVRSATCSISRDDAFNGPLFSLSGSLIVKNVLLENAPNMPLAHLSGGSFSAPDYASQLICTLKLPAAHSPVVRLQASYDDAGRMLSLSDLGELSLTQPQPYEVLFPPQTSSAVKDFLLCRNTLAPFIPTSMEITLT